MKKIILAGLLSAFCSLQAFAAPQVLHSSRHFPETVQHLQEALQSKGMTIFAVIEHQQAAAKHDLKMQPATVIVFGAPKAGTPLMQKDPYFALRLPLKVLVTEIDGQVQVVFEDAESLIAGSGIEYSDIENSLARVGTLLKNIVESK